MGLNRSGRAGAQTAQLGEGEGVRSADRSHVTSGAHDGIGQGEAAGAGRERILEGFGFELRGAAEFPLIVGEEFHLVLFGFSDGIVLID